MGNKKVKNNFPTRRMKTSIAIDPATWRGLRLYAIERGSDASAVVEDCLQQLLDGDTKKNDPRVAPSDKSVIDSDYQTQIAEQILAMTRSTIEACFLALIAVKKAQYTTDDLSIIENASAKERQDAATDTSLDDLASRVARALGSRANGSKSETRTG